MNSEQLQILSIPLSVMWGIQITSLSRYRLFNTHYLYNSKVLMFQNKQSRRLLMGIAFATVVPIAAIYLLSVLLESISGVELLISAAIASMSLFGITRLLHAFIMANGLWETFYDPWEFQEISKEMRLDLEYNNFYCHLIPGICWLTFWSSILFFYIKILH